ncbi:MAG TPA: UvrD-helicase domain-containing protein [Firmicutes bacterium]|nr:UvrD-helicase domain-containing protein [Bacillota bacterium]
MPEFEDDAGPGAPHRPWTGEQWSAITARGPNLLISAAAGSGKTSVLVERVIRRVTEGLDGEDPVDVDRLLVVTFTDSAAAEMRQRVGEALLRLVDRDPGNERIRRQLMLLNKAHISTLHSFCLSVLRQNFHRAGLDPAFDVMDEDESSLMLLEAVSQVFEEAYMLQGVQGEGGKDGGEGIAALVDRFGGDRGDEPLQDVVLSLYRFSRSQIAPGEWLKAAAAAFDVPPGVGPDDLPWTRVILEEARMKLDGARSRLVRALELASRPGGPAGYIPVLKDELEMCARLASACASGWWQTAAERFREVEFKKLPPVRPGRVDETLKGSVAALRDSAKAAIQELREGYFAVPFEELLADIRDLAPHMETLAGLVLSLDEAYSRMKRARALLDFNDLERYCLDILVDGPPSLRRSELAPSEIAIALRERFEEVLVDEYQDINAVQDAILRLVARNLFMVGDVKQSIYRFRLAEPRLFMEKYTSYAPYEPWVTHACAPGGGGSGRDASGSGYRITLSANFRSREGIVDAVNFVFRQILTERVGEVSYDRNAELVYSAHYPPVPESASTSAPSPPSAQAQAQAWPEPGSSQGEVEIHIIERNQDSGQDPGCDHGDHEDDDEDDSDEVDGSRGGPWHDSVEELQALELEARLAGACIHRIVGQGGHGSLVWDKRLKEYRPATFRDIAVLLRATRERANVFLEVFREMGIPAYAELGTGYFLATEVQVMLSLLQVIDNPRQDIPLAAVLRSPIVGLSASELAEIRIQGAGDGTAGRGAASAPAGGFYDAVLRVASHAAGRSGDSGSRCGAGDDPAGLSCSQSCLSLPGKLSRFLQYLEAWRTQARRRPLSELISCIFRDTGYLDIVGGMPGGPQRQANLRALYERARQFDKFSRPGLLRFLRHMRRLQDIQGDIGAARALGENEDVVRVMSIHKSKGLEFPVVIVADLGKLFNLKDLNKDILFHRDLGLGPMFVDPGLRIKRPTIAYRAIRERLRMETLAEELRVLYVAMTRAKEKLILVGSARNLAAMCEKFGGEPDPLPDEALAAARTCLDWICMATMRRDIQGAAGGGDEGGPIKLRFWNPGDVARLTATAIEPAGENAGADAKPVDPVVGRELERRLNWRYPHIHISRLAAKASVSELKRMIDFMADEIEGVRPDKLRPRPAIGGRPAFLRDQGGLTAAERGTVTHLVLQHLDLGGPLPLGLEEVLRQIEDMVRRELLTPEQAREVDARAIAGLFASPLGQRMVAAARRGRGNESEGGRGSWIMRELPFTMRMAISDILDIIRPRHPGSRWGDNGTSGMVGDPGELYRIGEGETEYVMVQGVIDCLVREDDGFLLVDFKTDHLLLGPESLAEMVDRYREQIDLYARAIENIYGEPVKQAFLYFLSAGKAVEVRRAPCRGPRIAGT